MARKRRMVTEREVTWTYEVGRRLRRARISHGYTQAEFAEMIEANGADLCLAEQGDKALALYPFFRACQILRKDANSMFGRKGRAVKK